MPHGARRRSRRKWSATLLLFVVALFAGCEAKPAPSDASPGLPSGGVVSPETAFPPPATSPAPIRFESLTDCGIDFTYYGNPSDEHFMTEQNGGGVGLFDFDLDGRLDVFLANGSNFARPATASIARHALYRNANGTGSRLTFTDVAEAARLGLSGFGMGVAAGDYDNDGFADLFLCEYGKITLFRNQGDGTFTDVSADAGLSSDLWAAGAAWADLDSDGDLDLYVTNYVEYSPDDPPCFSQSNPPVQISCGPIGRTAQPDTLWENRGDGTFRDVSEPAGIRSVTPGKGLAIAIVDLNGDRRLDIYVANDTTENMLFINEGDLRFSEQALVQGVAMGPEGRPESSMGIACADFDGNGWFDLFVTNFENAVNDYYDHVGPDSFLPRSREFGLDIASRPLLAFGTIAADFDFDQRPDLFIANGHIWDLTSLGLGYQYEMPPQLYWNDGGRRFEDVSASSGDYFREAWLGRSAAVGDLDGDGRPDLVVTHLKQPAAVLRNVSSPQGGAMRLRLVGMTAARTPHGVTVEYTCSGRTHMTHLPAGESFASSQEPVCVLSTGNADVIERIIVHWDAEHSESWTNLEVIRERTLRQGAGDVERRTLRH